MLTYLGLTGAVFVFLAAVFLTVDALLARWERCEKERWNRAFGGSGAARSGGRRDG